MVLTGFRPAKLATRIASISSQHGLRHIASLSRRQNNSISKLQTEAHWATCILMPTRPSARSRDVIRQNNAVKRWSHDHITTLWGRRTSRKLSTKNMNCLWRSSLSIPIQYYNFRGFKWCQEDIWRAIGSHNPLPFHAGAHPMIRRKSIG